MFQFAQQPLSIGKTWQSGFNLYQATLAKIWPLALATQFITYSSSLMVILLLDKTSLPHYSLATKIAGAALILLLTLISAYFCLLLLHRTNKLATNPNESLTESFRAARDKYWTYLLNITYRTLTMVVLLAASIVAMLAVLLILYALFTLIKFLAPAFTAGMTSHAKIPWIIVAPSLFLSFLPGCCMYIIAALSFMFNAPLILFDNKSGWAALKEGVQLIWGRGWRIILGTAIIPIITSIALNLFLALHQQNDLLTFAFFAAAVLLSTVLFMPLYLSLLLVQFNDLKQRQKNP